MDDDPVALLGHGCSPLSCYLSDDAGAYGAATLTDSEAHAFLKRHRLDEFDVHADVIARHNHLDTFRKRHVARDVGRADVELGTVARKERRMTAALLLREDIDLA